MTRIASIIEEASLSWFEQFEHALRSSPRHAPDEPDAERSFCSEVLLRDRLHTTPAAAFCLAPPRRCGKSVRTVLEERP